MEIAVKNYYAVGLYSPGGETGRFSRLWRPRGTRQRRASSKSMITVYVIKSLIKNYRYVDISKNINTRLKQHNSGQNNSTTPYRPFKLIYSEYYKDYKKARKREIFLKSGVGRKFLDSIK